MRKVAVVFLALALLMMMFVILPAMALPTEGQKVPVSLKFLPYAVLEKGDKVVTPSGIIFRSNYVLQYPIEVSIGGGDPIIGVAIAYTNFMEHPKAESASFIYHQYIVLSFASMPGGTFEGHATLILTDLTAPTMFNVKTHGLFHGTGVFGGQTINARAEGAPDAEWIGYLLKP